MGPGFAVAHAATAVPPEPSAGPRFHCVLRHLLPHVVSCSSSSPQQPLYGFLNNSDPAKFVRATGAPDLYFVRDDTVPLEQVGAQRVGGCVCVYVCVWGEGVACSSPTIVRWVERTHWAGCGGWRASGGGGARGGGMRGQRFCSGHKRALAVLRG